MQSTRAVMGRGTISTAHGSINILKHSTPDLLTYIQKAVQTGVYRSNEEIEEMNQELKENPTDIRRVRWNMARGSKIQDYPKEYEILSLNPPAPFKPRMPVKEQKKMQNKYVRENRPMDRLVNNYLRHEKHSSSSSSNGSEPATADDYYRRLLGSNKAPGIDTALGSKSAKLTKAYAVAVKQYHIMRTEDLSEKEALDKVEELLAKEDFEEKTTSRAKAEDLRSAHITDVETPILRAEKAFPGTMPKEHILKQKSKEEKHGGNTDAVSMLYSDSQRSFEGMINWTKRLQAVPYRQWSVGASVALDHWIAKRVLGLSEETWLALLEGESPELMGRGRDIVMARHALFPETVLDAELNTDVELGDESIGEATDKDQEELNALLATLSGLSGWEPVDKAEDISTPSAGNFDDASTSYGDVLTEELQAWRSQNAETPYTDWSEDKKREFMSWLQTFVSSLVSESSLGEVDLEETRRNLLEVPPDTREGAYEFWDSVRDETSAEIFLQKLLEEKGNDSTSADHPFYELDYQTQLERLVNLGTIRELANEYATEADRSKFLSRYGDYLLEGVRFEHLVLDPSGPIVGSDLGPQLLKLYDIDRDDRFSLKKIRYGQEEFGTEASHRARSMFRAWNKLKAGRANYEEKLFQKGLLGLSYNNENDRKGTSASSKQ